MPAPEALRKELHLIAQRLLRLKLLVVFHEPRVVGQPSASSIVCGGAQAAAGRAARASGTIDEYLDIVRSGDYFCLLNDGGVVQVQYDFQDLEVVAHRLAFLPCPWVFPAHDLRDGPILDKLDGMSEADRLDRLVCRGPIRIDFARDGADALHSAAHAHLVTDSCRMPVFGVVSPGLFLRFVFRRFYPEAWQESMPFFVET